MGRGPGRGRGQGLKNKTPRPEPLTGAGRGIEAGARGFRGPRGPVTNNRRLYPNQFGDAGLPLVNPPTAMEHNSPPNSPASLVFPSPKMRPAAHMKSLLNHVVKQARSLSTGSGLVQPPGPCVSQNAAPQSSGQLALRERSHSLTMRGAPVSPTGSPVPHPVA